MQDLEAVVREIGHTFKMKETTTEGDVVLIVAENPLTMMYGLVTAIDRDQTRKEEWWHLRMQILAFPPQKAVWTLRAPQFTGREIFSMGGERRFVKALDFDEDEEYGGRPPIDPGKRPSLRRVK